MLDRVGHVETALIIGGGSGGIIPSVVNICKGKIDFVEKSEKMIEMARRRAGSARITFHICDIQDFELEQYDLIITNFVLDVFDKEVLDKQIRRLSTCLNQDGKWAYVDFQESGKVRHRFLLWLMLRFFKATSDLQARKLYDHIQGIRNTGLTVEYEESSLDGFVRGVIFRTPTLQGS